MAMIEAFGPLFTVVIVFGVLAGSLAIAAVALLADY